MILPAQNITLRSDGTLSGDGAEIPVDPNTQPLIEVERDPHEQAIAELTGKIYAITHTYVTVRIPLALDGQLVYGPAA